VEVGLYSVAIGPPVESASVSTFESLFNTVLRLTQVHMGICRSRSLVSVSTVQCRVVLGPAVGWGVSNRTAIKGGKMGAELPL